MTNEEKLKTNYRVAIKSNDVLIKDEEGFDVSLFETYLIDNTKFKSKNEMCACALRLLNIDQNINRLNHKIENSIKTII